MDRPGQAPRDEVYAESCAGVDVERAAPATSGADHEVGSEVPLAGDPAELAAELLVDRAELVDGLSVEARTPEWRRSCA